LNARPASFTISKTVRRNKTLPWQRDLFEESLRAAGLPAIETGGKLNVTNLDVGVTNEDIRELFSEIGELKRYAIHYGKNGHPSGSAEVVYVRRGDAFKALSRYNNVQLDGKPMKIEVVGANSELPISARINVVPGVPGRRTVVMTRGGGRGGRGFGALNRVSGQKNRGGMRNNRGSGSNGAARGRGRGRGGRGGRGGGRGDAAKKKNVDKSADELDKELETYHATAMES
jgi:THO complex subunit 4